MIIIYTCNTPLSTGNSEAYISLENVPIQEKGYFSYILVTDELKDEPVIKDRVKAVLQQIKDRLSDQNVVFLFPETLKHLLFSCTFQNWQDDLLGGKIKVNEVKQAMVPYAHQQKIEIDAIKFVEVVEVVSTKIQSSQPPPCWKKIALASLLLILILMLLSWIISKVVLSPSEEEMERRFERRVSEIQEEHKQLLERRFEIGISEIQVAREQQGTTPIDVSKYVEMAIGEMMAAEVYKTTAEVYKITSVVRCEIQRGDTLSQLGLDNSLIEILSIKDNANSVDVQLISGKKIILPEKLRGNLPKGRCE